MSPGPLAWPLRSIRRGGLSAPFAFPDPGIPNPNPNPNAAAPYVSTVPPPVSSPCIGVCTMDEDGLCMGCLRTLDEIAAWSALADEERRRIMVEVLPEREAERGLR